MVTLFACTATAEDERRAAEPSDESQQSAGEEAGTDETGPASEPAGALPWSGFALEARPDGALRLTEPPPDTSDQNAAFSPDGTLILFTRFDNGYNEGPAGMYLLDLVSGEINRLFWEDDQDAVNMPGTSWNSVSDRIVFASDRAGRGEIWTMADDGSDLFQVTEHSTDIAYAEPTFSPDGEWIAFQVVDFDVPEDEQRGSLWLVRADGSGLRQLTDGPGGGYDDRQPNWSPAGDQIVFQRLQAGAEDWDLYTIRADGSDLRQVTSGPADDTDASWSPDGRRIVYSSNYGDLPVPVIFIISAEGGEPIWVTYTEDHYDGAISWSPDGMWIVFESHPGEEDSPTALWIIAAPELAE